MGLKWWFDKSSGLIWWSGRIWQKSGPPVVARRNSGDGRGGARRQERSPISLLLSFDLGSLFKRKWGSIYKFFEWHGP
ncbi:hypothetical protein MA16_Dca018171 [Dendrobium catenatum]|uniref:Uncharacterized protein n=1 Tax=Dendrobium catenatum TaxID=906689 RepID=A0A2I0VST5_9ASPA|nr:hypothetical protein MA16_Dca018171 [Dendrobium catenatum]